jgi:hypothetical protein
MQCADSRRQPCCNLPWRLLDHSRSRRTCRNTGQTAGLRTECLCQSRRRRTKWLKRLSRPSLYDMVSLNTGPVVISPRSEKLTCYMLSCPSRLKRATGCQTALCAFFGCWLAPPRRVLVSRQTFRDRDRNRLSAIVPGLRRFVAWLFCRASRLFVLAHTGPQLRKLQRPVSCLAVQMMASLFFFLGTSQLSTTYDLPLYHKLC